MTRPKFGISPSPEVTQQLDDLVEERVDLGELRDRRSSPFSVSPTGGDRTSTTRELVIRLRQSR